MDTTTLSYVITGAGFSCTLLGAALAFSGKHRASVLIVGFAFGALLINTVWSFRMAAS